MRLNPQCYLSGICLVALFAILGCKRTVPNYSSFEAYPVYQGDDLGLTFSKKQSSFKVWAPTANEVELLIYDHPFDGRLISSHSMQPDVAGTWAYVHQGNHLGKYYVYRAKFENQLGHEVQDPYSKLVGINGSRTYIGPLSSSDPTGFENDVRPDLGSYHDIVLYELHVRDITKHPSSGAAHPGKFAGLAQSGTVNKAGLSTGLDHLTELGVTHAHLLPVFDFKSLDETQPDSPEYNWGYDPLNFFAVEGSYSTDAWDPIVRAKEFKALVMALHQKGIRVVMDVVFNHTGPGWDSNLNQLVPNYYYRLDSDSTFSNASACGNETASNHPMFRKLMVDAIKFWINEYHIDGFRFDLMGIHDLETMNEIRYQVDQIDTSIFMYGEGWTPADSPYPFDQRALKHNISQVPGVAVFNDELRDGVKGPWNNHEEKGFVAGKPGLEESIRFGIAGASFHPDVRLKRVNYSNTFWASQPNQCITFVSCHDDLTLYDKWKRSCPECSIQELKQMQAIALTFVLTSQGIPFLHAGTEFLRSKGGVDDSYKSPDVVNAIDWQLKTEHDDLHKYIKGLIRLRKNHPGFRLGSKELVAQHLKFLHRDEKSLVMFQITGQPNGETWNDITVAVNGRSTDAVVNIPEGQWKVVVKGLEINENGIDIFNGNQLIVPKKSAAIFYRM